MSEEKMIEEMIVMAQYGKLGPYSYVKQCAKNLGMEDIEPFQKLLQGMLDRHELMLDDNLRVVIA